MPTDSLGDPESAPKWWMTPPTSRTALTANAQGPQVIVPAAKRYTHTCSFQEVGAGGWGYIGCLRTERRQKDRSEERAVYIHDVDSQLLNRRHEQAVTSSRVFAAICSYVPDTWWFLLKYFCYFSHLGHVGVSKTKPLRNSGVGVYIYTDQSATSSGFGVLMY